MRIDKKMLSNLRGVGVGAVIAAYVAMCFAQFNITFVALVVALVIDVIIVWKDFETISHRIHSWLGQKGDMAVNIGAFVFNIWVLSGHTFTWWEYGIASVFWITHGHLWWNRSS